MPVFLKQNWLLADYSWRCLFTRIKRLSYRLVCIDKSCQPCHPWSPYLHFRLYSITDCRQLLCWRDCWVPASWIFSQLNQAKEPCRCKSYPSFSSCNLTFIYKVAYYHGNSSRTHRNIEIYNLRSWPRPCLWVEIYGLSQSCCSFWTRRKNETNDSQCLRSSAVDNNTILFCFWWCLMDACSLRPTFHSSWRSCQYICNWVTRKIILWRQVWSTSIIVVIFRTNQL